MASTVSPTASLSALFGTKGISNIRSGLEAADLGGKPPHWLDLKGDKWRTPASHVVYGPILEVVIGIILLFNFAVMVVDTDIRASGKNSPPWVDYSVDVCSVVYFIEFALRWFVERRMVLRSTWNRLDFMVLSLTLVEKLLSALTSLNPTSLMLVRVFRIFRLLRLVRAVKLMSSLKELRKLIQMMATCVKTLFWSCVLTFILMTMWSVMFVELISPIVEALEERQGVWGGDADWTESYRTVMRANLTLFQTIVAGDSWGKVPIPVIDAAPWTILLFLPAQVTLVFGVLNLILAVIVDTFAENRSNDHAAREAEMEREEKQEKDALAKIFNRIDEDASGTVTLEELEEGAANDTEFRQRLRVMDVSKADLQQLFSILDDDDSGDVDPEEFIDTLYRMKCADSRTATVLVKHTVAEIMKRQERMDLQLREMMEVFKSGSDSKRERRVAVLRKASFGGKLRDITPTDPPFFESAKSREPSCDPPFFESTGGPPISSRNSTAELIDADMVSSSLSLPRIRNSTTTELTDAETGSSSLSLPRILSPQLPVEDCAPSLPQMARGGFSTRLTPGWFDPGAAVFEPSLQAARNNADVPSEPVEGAGSEKPCKPGRTKGVVLLCSEDILHRSPEQRSHALLVEFRPDKTKRPCFALHQRAGPGQALPTIRGAES